MSTTFRTAHRFQLPVTVLVAGLALTLSSCGGEPESTSASDSASASASPAGAGEMPTMPGAAGQVAAVDGTTMQVRSAGSGQVAVSWTDATSITQQVAGELADVTVGSCVVVSSAPEQEDTTGAVAAASVRISAAEDGACEAGFGGGGPGGGAGGDRPEGERPTDAPEDGASAPTMPEGMGSRVTGEVTSVEDGGFTVEATARPTGEPGSETETETETVTVTVAADTTYTTAQEASATAITAGRCVSALGERDDTGAVSADTISVSDAVDGECSTGGLPGARGDS